MADTDKCGCQHERQDHVKDGCNARVGEDGKLCPCEKFSKAKKD